jgi:hypothetical protein
LVVDVLVRVISIFSERAGFPALLGVL